MVIRVHSIFTHVQSKLSHSNTWIGLREAAGESLSVCDSILSRPTSLNRLTIVGKAGQRYGDTCK